MRAQVQRSYRAIATGMVDDVADYVHDDFVNEEAVNEPPAAMAGGPRGFATTVAWLRMAYSELSFTERDFVQDGDRYASEVTMHGTHTGPLVVRDGEGYVVLPPSGRRFAHRQVHLGRVADGKVVEHRAIRDDLGLLQQLGYAPPTPGAITRQLWWAVSGRRRAAIAAFERLEPTIRPRTGSAATPAHRREPDAAAAPVDAGRRR
jgi:predicted ester cyclase